MPQPELNDSDHLLENAMVKDVISPICKAQNERNSYQPPLCDVFQGTIYPTVIDE